MQTKVCVTCKEVLSVDEFYARRDQGGHHSECKSCKRVRSAARYQSNVKRHAELVRRRYESFGRFKRYGLTAEQYAAQLARQGHRCALCGVDKPGGKGKWHIDHAHTGDEERNRFNQADAVSFRGILCHRCNVALGHYEALVERIGHEVVAGYLKSRCLT